MDANQRGQDEWQGGCSRLGQVAGLPAGMEFLLEGVQSLEPVKAVDQGGNQV